MVLETRNAVGVRGQENQAVLLLAWLLAAAFQDHRCCVDSWRLGRASERRLRRQHNEAQRPIVGYVGRRREDVDAAEDAAGETQLVFDEGVHVLKQVEAALAVFHLTAQVGPDVEPIAIVRAVEVLQTIDQRPHAILVVPQHLAGLHRTEKQVFEFNTAMVLGAADRASVGG